MDEELTQFVSDAREMVEKLYHDLEQLRSARTQGRQRRELAARIFRRVHTLKGSAGSLGLKPVSQIAHDFEGVLDGVRLGRIEITDSVLDLFEDGTDAIARALESSATKETSPGAIAVIRQLAALAAESKKQGTIASTLRSALPPEIARSLSEYDLQHTREAVREGAKLFVVLAGFALESFDRNFRELTKVLGQCGEIISTGPGEPSTMEDINFRLLYAAELVPAEVLRQAEALGQIEITEIKLDASTAETKVAPSMFLARPPTPDIAETVRVDLRQLDELISGASELFRYTTNALQSLSAADKLPFENATTHLRRRFVELEERLIKLRLVPAGEVLSRAAARGGRIAARRLGKEVEFEIVGGDVGIDKSLADTIADPLLHLVRNAVTHGIESPAERTAAGKDPLARIKLAAFNEGSRIHITVTDDGRGIDWERVVAAATAQGIAGDAADLSTDQCLRLIFRPGFSTTTTVSELSGRGIGLDVVDRAMEQAGGEVRVATELGAGTTFAMIMPATLALVQCLLVQSGNQLYAIESAGVSGEPTAAFDSADETAQVNWQGESLPVLHLARLLGQESGSFIEGTMMVWQTQTNGAAAASNENPKRYALRFDAARGHQETLVRSLGRHAARWNGVCGAAEMFDGNVALVLDLEELIRNYQDKRMAPPPK
ncbi:MAG: two-component system, chemotaxis family, sensor kinase CheA [Blastocatellia bacterium]|nr:two-component system, chemotaxis family, sensor kinase CheA [Blastocatellia bacterium]